MSLQNQLHRSHRRHHSSSTQSTQSSAYRSSNGSAFSSWQPRDSVASSNTTWTQLSDLSQEQYIVETEQMLGAHSPIEPPPANVILEPVASTSQPAHRRQPSQEKEKESFLTCVSRIKKARRGTREPRYWCTSCEEGFREKYDWKRHEETYQERTDMFECDLCLNKYFLDKDFVHHHKGSHRCNLCVPHQHVERARKKRIARTGWGCGFCTHFSTDWTERCNHISQHFEKKGQTMRDWKHSKVINSLLQRPEILREFWRLLERDCSLKGKQQTQRSFEWRAKTTGRKEGYPENKLEPQLQDLLEFFTPGQDAAYIARLAFETGLCGKPSSDAPPPLPKDDRYTTQPIRQTTFHPEQNSASMHKTYHDNMHAMSIMPDMSGWNGFLDPIVEDEWLPTNVVTLDDDSLNAAFGHHCDHY